MKDKRYIIISVITIILLCCLFLVLNLLSLNEKHKAKNTNTTTKTTTTKAPEEPDLAIQDKIMIEGVEETIYVKKYITHLGFEFKYQSEYFKVSFLSNGSVLIEDLNDSKNYIQIEKVNESDYYREYEELSDKEDLSEDGYLTTYKFYRGNSLTFLKVTKCIKNDTEHFEGLNVRMDYITDSLYFN